MNKKGILDPINILICIIALLGAIAFFINQPNYGLVLLIISTLVEAIARLVK